MNTELKIKLGRQFPISNCINCRKTGKYNPATEIFECENDTCRILTWLDNGAVINHRRRLKTLLESNGNSRKCTNPKCGFDLNTLTEHFCIKCSCPTKVSKI